MTATILTGLGVLAALAWIGLHGIGAITLARVARLPALAPGSRSRPTLSVVLAACNEQDSIERSVCSLLEQAYSGLEVVLVDDRSTDGTGEIADRLAAGDPRVRVVHVTDLPAGWLGKVHALQRGTDAATGEFLLYADADVRFAPGALERAIDFALAHDLDHLTLLPHLEANSLAARALMQEFFVGYVRRTGGARGPVQKRKPFGYGAFNLVRRAALARTAGFEWLRMEVLDDLGLGALMKDSGARCGFAVAPDALSVLWYSGIAAAVRGFEKNTFGGLAGYRLSLAIGMSAASAFLGIGPALLLTDAPLAARVAGGLALAAVAAEAIVARVRFGHGVAAGLLSPATHLLMAWALLAGALACVRRGGIRTPS